MKTLFLIAIVIVAGCVQAVGADDKIDFNRQIKPILAENCFACHGLDAAAREADLRLDDRDAAIDAGAFVPGEPDASSLVERIFETDEDIMMPPPASHKQLTSEQKEWLKLWVTQGADYKQHWSLIAPQKPELPTVKNDTWARNELDRLVLARLEAEQLTPNSDTEMATYFRRLSLDINGLPPSPADSVAFAKDYEQRGEAAVSEWIDRLMDRPTWGEHRARYWLDAARYADTHGMHFDNYREMWPYRDWVIRAFNANQPFDQFSVEQLAGDLLENPTQDQLIATGFQRCNMTTNEGGTIDEENLAIYATDRVQTFGWVYLGLTTNCCQCHDHKFDALSMKDYYSLAAFFRNTDQPAKDGNVKTGNGPVLNVPLPDDLPRWEALPPEITEMKLQRDARFELAKPKLEPWLASLDIENMGEFSTEGLILHLPINEGTGNVIHQQKQIRTEPSKSKESQSESGRTKIITRMRKRGSVQDPQRASLTRRVVNPAEFSTTNTFSSARAENEADVTPVGIAASLQPDERSDVTRVSSAGQPVVTTKDDIKWESDGLIGPTTRVNKAHTLEIGDHGDFAIDQPFSVGCWVKTTDKNTHGAFIARMDPGQGHRGWDVAQNGEEFVTHLIDTWPENALKIRTTGKPVKANQWQHVFVTWDGSGKLDGLKLFVDGQLVPTEAEKNTLKDAANSHVKTPLRLGSRTGGDYSFDGYVQGVMLYDRLLPPTEIANLASWGPIRLALESKPEDRQPEQTQTLLRHYLEKHDTEFVSLEKRLTELETEQSDIKSRSPVTHIQREQSTPAMADIMLRGAYDKLGEKVSAAPPLALHPLPPGAPANRLGLAQWVVDPANPLTARVTVNRFWQEVFGQGIVATTEDFGVMGSPPSNQALLDWLAVDFQESGWDVKRLFKMMLMSSTYRQSAMVSADSLERDRDNALLSRGPRFRMDAEMVRDYALAASDLLTKKMYGPGARPYQPDNLWEIVGLPGGDTRKYVQDTGADVYRRSVYSFWKRMSPPPNLEAFNAPSREVCAVRRERTNTPLQALVTLNDPQFFEAARVLAQHAMIAGSGDDDKTLEFIAARTVCRDFNEQEMAIINEDRQRFLNEYRANADEANAVLKVGQSPADESLDAAELAAWTLVCNQLLNLDEVLTK